MNYKNFCIELNKHTTEEDVKNSYKKHFDIDGVSSDRHDLYNERVLFEFKYNKNFDNLKIRATVLAQILYYVRKLKFKETEKQIPPILCLADKHEVILTETIIWKDFTTDTEDKYDWYRQPSNPDEKLVEDLSNEKSLRNIHIYNIHNEQEYKLLSEKLNTYLDKQLQLILSDKKIITEENFEDVYEYWNKNFGEDVRNGLKASKYFISDIQKGKTHIIKKENKIVFAFDGGQKKIKQILYDKYEYFWNIYEKVSNQDLIRSMIAKLDRLTDSELRKFKGEFYTPLPFAKKGLDYLEKTLGKKWWNKNYRIWDMAAGTGNLQYHLPSEAWEYMYLSTYHEEDVEHCKKLFPKATVFKYDYLNDDVENIFANGSLPFDKSWELPKKLMEDLDNPKIKWVILINPPFATAQTAGGKKKSKADVSNTKLRTAMHNEDLGEVSRELFAQFLFRIRTEFKDKQAHLGLFSTLKYINATNDQKFRDNVFHFSFENGFVFSSANFDGTKENNAFPIGFLIWDLATKKKIEKQKIVFDVFNNKTEKIGRKHITSEHRDSFLSKWIERPQADIIFPPLGGAINVKSNNKDVRDRISEGFIGSLMCCGNDLQHQNYTSLLSAPYASAGAHSITPEIFEQSMVVHAVRRIPKADWLNDRDQFMQPNRNLLRAFIVDCTVWNLFFSSNQTVAMKDVRYKKEIYQIQNHFFPFKIQDVKKWVISNKEISKSLLEDENRFVAKWLDKENLSKDASELLEIGKEVYKFYFEHITELRINKFKINTWDAGFYQVRMCLKEQNLAKELLDELVVKRDKLKNKILPDIYE